MSIVDGRDVSIHGGVCMSKTVCFTGHRTIPAKYLAVLPALTDAMLERLYNAGYRTFITGGAEGFDTLAASRIIRYRAGHADVRLVMALPYERSGSAAYRKTVEAADEVIYISRAFYTGVALERDRYMVDRSDACVAFYLPGRGGGTYYTVRYANERSVPVVNLVRDPER